MNLMRSTGSFMNRRGIGMAGFTLLELLVAMAVFGVISAAAFGLIAQHQPIFNQQQTQAALNISMRNAIAQMQIDIVNGGAGYYNNINVPGSPVGIVINNPTPALTSASNCATGTTYGAKCFDSFTVIVADPLTTAVNPLTDSQASLPVVAGTCTSGTTQTSADHDTFVQAPSSGGFQVNDQVLFVTANGNNYTTVKLTGVTPVTVGGVNYVKLSHSVLTIAGGTNNASDDETGMSVNNSDLTTDQFCAADYVIRLLPIEYYVDITTDPNNPTLRRLVLVGGASAVATPGSGVALANQIIGFKVGASLATSNTDVYNFNSSGTVASSGYNYDFTLVRSVMISLVGRTPPNVDPTFVFRNSFDGGPYMIQGASVVVNPRNMSI
jgi:prepilin-type N-terminal cleavage/methylation domain-containing protein